MNTVAYIIYLFVTYLITVHVGLVFYRNGRHYILALLKGDEDLTGFINKILLTGYYLVNLGYAALMLQTWKTVTNWAGLAGSVMMMTGRILITLGVMHFLNMALIYLLSRKSKRIFNNKT